MVASENVFAHHRYADKIILIVFNLKYTVCVYQGGMNIFKIIFNFGVRKKVMGRAGATLLSTSDTDTPTLKLPTSDIDFRYQFKKSTSDTVRHFLAKLKKKLFSRAKLQIISVCLK